jgi:hypothetical protein
MALKMLQLHKYSWYLRALACRIYIESRDSAQCALAGPDVVAQQFTARSGQASPLAFPAEYASAGSIDCFDAVLAG